MIPLLFKLPSRHDLAGCARVCAAAGATPTGQNRMRADMPVLASTGERARVCGGCMCPPRPV